MKESHIIQVKINPFINTDRKYRNHLGKIFWVYNFIDNHGDYCLAYDNGEPFVCISAKDCQVLINPSKEDYLKK